jgi:hypothetical protein
MSAPLEFAQVDPEVVALARQMAVGIKKWGRVPQKAIESGQWDNGEVVRQFIPEAERALLRRRREARDD